MKHLTLALILSVAVAGSLPAAPEAQRGGFAPALIDPDHAVVTFEVNEDGAIVHAYAGVPDWATLVLEEIDGAAVAVDDTLRFSAASGRTDAIELAGLTAGTAYRYQLRFQTGTTSQWYRFRTAPAPDADVGLKLVFGACIETDPQYASPIFDSMAASGADFLLSLGDWPYTDRTPAAQTVAEFRVKHRVVRTLASLDGLLRSMGVYAIYDDHEVRNDWDGAFTSQNPAVVAAALAVWDEWFPLRDRSQDPLRYRSWRWGKHAEVFMLDTRRYRSANDATDDSSKTMLGASQKEWLLDGLRGSTATFKLVVTSVPLAFASGDDHWSTFATERDEILNVIADEAIGGVVFLTSDRHYFEVHHYASGLVEYQVGPFAARVATAQPAQPEVVVQVEARNYGEIVIVPGNSPQLVFAGRDENGEILFTETPWPSAANSPEPSPAVREMRLHAISPNPFNAAAEIRYDVPPHRGGASVRVYDVSGRLVRSLVTDDMAVGQRQVIWRGCNDRGVGVASGVYYAVLELGEHRLWRKMLLLK